MLNSTKAVSLSFPIACGGGGEIDQSGSSIVINDCIDTNGSLRYLTRGTYTVTESGSLTTHTWDQEVLVDDNNDGTFASDETSFSTTGSISFDTADEQVAYDFSAVFSGETIRIAGIVNDNSDDSSDATFSILLDDVTWKDGLFNDTNLSSLTDSTVNEGCTDDDDPDCSTLECANDFQCQIFADEDQTDAYTVGNIACVSGCCAAVEAVEEDSCPGSTTCTTVFQCQMFADDSTTDEFTTSNVECSNGCCAVAN